MDSELIQQAIDLVRMGDKSGAIKILKEIVTKDPKNENAWLWLASCFEKPENKIHCLQKVLKINPKNQRAKQALERLTPAEPLLDDLVPSTAQNSVKLHKTIKPQMGFIKDFLRNLAILMIIGVVLFIIAPDYMNQVFQLYRALLGPIIIVVVVVAALPRKKRAKRW